MDIYVVISGYFQKYSSWRCSRINVNYSPAGKQAALFMALTTLVSTPFLLANMLYCEQVPFAGVTSYYTGIYRVIKK